MKPTATALLLLIAAFSFGGRCGGGWEIAERGYNDYSGDFPLEVTPSRLQAATDSSGSAR